MRRIARTRSRFTVITTALAAAILAAASAYAQIVTQPTTDTIALGEALHARGLRITGVQILNGDASQFGIYAGCTLLPVTMPDGLVLSSGCVAAIGPTSETQAPDYDPASPPWFLSSDLQSGATQEFTDYGALTGAIFNFFSVNDVASIEVSFELDAPGSVKFDFVFGSVEYPFWTSQYTDSFVAFLDGTAPGDQVSFDANGVAIQVGQSFADLVTVNDSNTAFASPHGLIRKLTTTTRELEDGEHTLRFEVGDVNDGILDSAVLITNLRAETGTEGTGQAEPDDCISDLDRSGEVDAADISLVLLAWGPGYTRDIDEDGSVDAGDLSLLLLDYGPCPGAGK